MKNFNRVFGAALFASVSALGMTSQAFAQAADEANSGGLDEIIVTAQKRGENLQQTPLAISAISSEQLDLQQIAEAKDLGALAPNVSVVGATTNATAMVLTIRGIPTAADESQGYDSPIGIYVDGVYMARSSASTFEVADVERVYSKKGRCHIAVSEGIHDASGAPIITTLAKDLEHDAHGNVQLSGSGALADLLCDQIKSKLGIKRVRGDTFGYLQRSFIGCVSDVDQREAREVGEKAVQFAMWGSSDGSVAIKRAGYYAADYELLPLQAVAGKTRVMDDAFIAPSGSDVTDAQILDILQRQGRIAMTGATTGIAELDETLGGYPLGRQIGAGAHHQKG